MLYLLYGFTIITFAFLRKRKWNWLFYTFVLCFLLWTSQGTYADFDGYYEIFERITYSEWNISGATPGWYLLCKLFASLGLNYYGMTIVLILCSCALLHGLFSKFDVNENIIWSVLFVFPILINGIQMRFFFAMSIIVYFLEFILFEVKRPILKYVIGIILATTIHTAAAIFTICLLTLVYEKHKTRTNIIKTLLICVMTFFGVLLVPTIARKFLLASQYERYISNSITESSFKWFFAITVCWLITIFLFKLVMQGSIYFGIKNMDFKVVYKRLFRVICLLGLTIPLLMFDRNYHRFIQLGFILDALCLGIYWKNQQASTLKTKNNKWLVLGIFITALIPAIYLFEFIPVNATAPLFDIVGFPSIFR